MADTNVEALEAKLSYLQGIADRDRSEIESLRRKRTEHEERAESFRDYVEAKRIASARDKENALDAMEASKMHVKMSDNEYREFLKAESEEIRSETLAWNEAKRSADREARRQERISVRDEMKRRKAEILNQESAKSRERQTLNEQRKEKLAWIEAKKQAELKEKRELRDRLVEIYQSSNGTEARERLMEAKAARKAEIDKIRDEKRAKYEMLQRQREERRRSAAKRLADESSERKKNVRLQREKLERERQRKADEREKARQEANQRRAISESDKRTKIWRLQRRNKLTMEAKRNAELLEKRAERARSQQIREAAKKNRVAVNAAKREKSDKVRGHIDSALEAAKAAREALLAERSSLIASKHGANFASSAKSASASGARNQQGNNYMKASRHAIKQPSKTVDVSRTSSASSAKRRKLQAEKRASEKVMRNLMEQAKMAERRGELVRAADLLQEAQDTMRKFLPADMGPTKSSPMPSQNSAHSRIDPPGSPLSVARQLSGRIQTLRRRATVRAETRRRNAIARKKAAAKAVLKRQADAKAAEEKKRQQKVAAAKLAEKKRRRREMMIAKKKKREAEAEAGAMAKEKKEGPIKKQPKETSKAEALRIAKSRVIADTERRIVEELETTDVEEALAKALIEEQAQKAADVTAALEAAASKEIDTLLDSSDEEDCQEENMQNDIGVEEAPNKATEAEPKCSSALPSEESAPEEKTPSAPEAVSAPSFDPPPESPGLMMLKAEDDEDEVTVRDPDKKGDSNLTMPEDKNVSEVMQKSAPTTLSPASGIAVSTSPIIARTASGQKDFSMAGYSLEEIVAASKGASRKDGGLNKGGIVEILEANELSSSGKRSDLEQRLCQLIDQADN